MCKVVHTNHFMSFRTIWGKGESESEREREKFTDRHTWKIE